MASCIDLAERYGKQYRIDYEPQSAQWPRTEHAWLARIRCQYGHVGVQGGERLYAFTDRPVIGGRLRRLRCVERAQGDLEVRVVFHVDHLAAILAILRPRHRRQFTEAEIERLKAVGAAHRFGQIHGAEGAQTVLESFGAAGDKELDSGGASDAKSATRAAGGSGEAA